MADTLLAGPSANTLDPRVGNDKRKALLQMMMQHVQGGAGVAANAGALGSGAPGGISFLGGIRAIPRNREGLGNTDFTQGSQIASQFLGGMGVGARQAPQSSPGQVVAQFIGGPAGGGASGASSAPNPTAVAPAGAPVAGPAPVPAPAPAGPMMSPPPAPAPVAPSPVMDANQQVLAAGGPSTSPNPSVPAASGFGPSSPGASSPGARSIFNTMVHQPSAAPAGLVALGSGAYYNPTTQTVHYL